MKRKMTTEEQKERMMEEYPVVLIRERGLAGFGDKNWLALFLDVHDLPCMGDKKDSDYSCDITVSIRLYGFGATPEEAMSNLFDSLLMCNKEKDVG